MNYINEAGSHKCFIISSLHQKFMVYAVILFEAFVPWWFLSVILSSLECLSELIILMLAIFTIVEGSLCLFQWADLKPMYNVFPILGPGTVLHIKSTHNRHSE